MWRAAPVQRASELLLSVTHPLFTMFAEKRGTVNGHRPYWIFQSAQRIYGVFLLPVVSECEDCRTTGIIYNDYEDANDRSNE